MIVYHFQKQSIDKICQITYSSNKFIKNEME